MPAYDSGLYTYVYIAMYTIYFYSFYCIYKAHMYINIYLVRLHCLSALKCINNITASNYQDNHTIQIMQ